MAPKKQLIELDAAKKLFDDIPPFIGMTGKCVQEMLDGAPKVDAVEVVRCGNCKSFTEGMAVGICKRDPDKPIFPVPHNHFCSYGERREET